MDNIYSFVIILLIILLLMIIFNNLTLLTNNNDTNNNDDNNNNDNYNDNVKVIDNCCHQDKDMRKNYRYKDYNYRLRLDNNFFFPPPSANTYNIDKKVGYIFRKHNGKHEPTIYPLFCIEFNSYKYSYSTIINGIRIDIDTNNKELYTDDVIIVHKHRYAINIDY